MGGDAAARAIALNGPFVTAGSCLPNRFGSEAYAAEKRRAELASVFIGAEAGLPCDIPNHASYLASWITALKADKREIFRAASDAHRIADYVLAFHPGYSERVLAAADPRPDGGETAHVELPRRTMARTAGVRP